LKEVGGTPTASNDRTRSPTKDLEQTDFDVKRKMEENRKEENRKEEIEFICFDYCLFIY